MLMAFWCSSVQHCVASLLDNRLRLVETVSLHSPASGAPARALAGCSTHPTPATGCAAAPRWSCAAHRARTACTHAAAAAVAAVLCSGCKE